MHIYKTILSCAVTASLAGCIYVPVPAQPPSSPAVSNYVAPEPLPRADPEPAPPVAVVEYQAPPPEVAPVYERELTPYGRWFVDPRYGRCWRPNNVAYGWQPYTVGHWVYTDDGSCYWVSEDREVAWGNTVYHYGQWAFTAQTGWIWVPGTVWAPAWVAWREGGGYCGWAPLPPEACQREVDIVMVDRYCPPDRYVYCDEHRFHEDHADRYIVHNNVTIINRTTNITNVTIVNNRVINRGVPADNIRRVSGRDVNRLQITEATSPEDAHRLEQQGRPVHYVNPAIEQVHTRVVQQQSQLQDERQKKAQEDRQLQQLKQEDHQKQQQLQQQAGQDRQLNRQKAVEEARQAASDQKLAHDKQVEADRQAQRDRQLEHQKEVDAAAAAKRAEADQRANDSAAQRQAAHDAQVQREQQAAAAKQEARDRAAQAARDAAAQRQAERDKAAADNNGGDKPNQGKPNKAKPKPGQPPAQPPQ